MNADRRALPSFVLRSRMMRGAALLRERPWGVFLGGLAVDLALLGGMHFVDARNTYVGAPAAITSLIVVSGALVAGPHAGAALALTAGIAYDALIVTDQWLVSGITSAVVIVVWLLAGIAAGMLGDRYRRQVGAALADAAAAREAVERVLDVTPSFHVSGSLAGVARAVCEAGLQTTGCAAAVLVTVEEGGLRLVARAPGGAEPAATPVPLDAFPGIKKELTTQTKPSFVPDVAEFDRPTLLVDLAGFTDLGSALRVPVVLDDHPVAVLTLGWASVVPAPEPAWLAAVQRFADHAAVALERARRVEAERSAARLYHRFEASLVPEIETSASDLRVAASYLPGERGMRLGGDFIDLVTRSDGAVRGVIGDVSGHGPDAAAFGASLRAGWRALAHRDLGAAETMGTLNDIVMEESDRAERETGRMPVMATMCLVEISADRAAATLVTAGHPPALLLVDGEIRSTPFGDPLLGVGRYEWTAHTLLLPEVWTLLLYTDGIIEARVGPKEHARVGIEGLVSLLRQAAPTPTDADLRALTVTIQRMNGGPLPDDATLLALSRVRVANGAGQTWSAPVRRR